MILRPALMLGCALGALALSGRAEAQAFNANPVTIAGGVLYDRATPGVETITLDTSSAIILWVPNVGGNPINFLPAGRVATFINGPSTGNFAVLNRIQTDVPIQFNGTVLSRLQDPALGTSVPGGTVIFSSPNGIIVGPNALFDVGNLILTSLTVTDDGAGNFIDPGGTIQMLGGDKFPKAGVIVLPGGQILANSENSFVGLIAPNVQQGGFVRVNGSTAYVAAEGVDFRVNAGLFDLIVTAGTQNAVPLIHTGTTGGPASTGAGDIHRIYMVAVPKNMAITAMLQGNVGFDAAVNVGVENGAIVLSAGHSVAGGDVDRFADFSPPPAPDLQASFLIQGGTIRSDLFGTAVTDMLAGGNLAFLQDVSLVGGKRAHLFAGPNQTLTVAGNALVSTARNRTINLNPIDLSGAEAQIFAQGGGSVDIFGNAIVDSSAQGVVNVVTSIAGHGTGGAARLFADTGGSVRVRGDTQLLVTGAGGMLDLSPDRGGNGQGGVAAVEGRNGGQVRLDGTLAMDASGTGSRSNGSANPGATGTGGVLSVAAFGGGSVTIAGATAMTANGAGGEVTGGNIAGGTGHGGQLSLIASGNVTLNGDAALAADGFGGVGPTGGAAQGGILLLVSAPPAGGTAVLNAPNITGTASATGVAATGNTPGEWHINNSAGSSINLVNLSLTAAANGTLGVRPFSSVLAQGIVRVTQLAQFTTPGEIRVIGQDAGRILGGRYNFAAGEDVTMTHLNPVAGGFTIDVTDLFVVAGDDVSAGTGVVTRTTGQTDIRAADGATVAGRILGPSILIRSSDIDLTGAVGDAGTQVATLQVNPGTQAATLGAAAQGPGYTLTNAEAGRIRAETLRIQVPALGANPALFVRDVTFNGGGAAAGIGTLDLITPGIARVEGNLLMANARAQDGIAFTATQRLEVVTPAGGVRVRDALGAPGGSLALTSNNIWAASGAVIDRLRLDPNYAGRDADLLDNGGADVPRGYVEGNAVTLNTAATLFVQNSGFGIGTFATGLDFAGITVGPGGLVVRATGVNPVTATAFGRRVNADGSFTTGFDFFFATTFQEPVRFTAGSTFNTCIIPTGQCPAQPPGNAIPGQDPTVGPLGGGSTGGSTTSTDAVRLSVRGERAELVDTSFSAETLIEEPVTSGGESILWEGDGDCDRDNDGDCDEVRP